MTDAYIAAAEDPGRLREQTPKGCQRRRRGRTRRKLTHRQKTLRAFFRAYLDLLDTAQWMRDWLRAQLEGFGLDLLGLRVLDMLYRDRPMELIEAAQARGCTVMNMHRLIGRLERSGWVRRDVMRRFPAEVPITRIPIARRDKKRLGRRVCVLRLTSLGEKLIGTVLPKHEKVVKALMRALDGREQETLSLLCRKLRKGEIMRFLSEMTHRHDGE